MKNIFLSLAILLTCLTQAQQIDEPQPVHIEVTGSGAPVLLIPGFTVPGKSWDSIVGQLEKNHQCHILTLAGFGGKAPIEFPWLPKVNESIENYIHKNQLNNLTVIGHSLGGTIGPKLSLSMNEK